MYLMRLTYYSSPSITIEHGGRTNALKDILAASRRNNADSGITGTLFFNDEYFAQVIEGDRDQVSQSFLRISQDERQAAEQAPPRDRLKLRRVKPLEWVWQYGRHAWPLPQ